MDSIRQYWSQPIPHFTTHQKFLCRIKPLYFNLLLKNTLKLFYSEDDVISMTAIDSSGFTSGYCSHYYSERTGNIRKHFLKTSISIDTDMHIGFTISKSRVHDSKRASYF
jgi:transposase